MLAILMITLNLLCVGHAVAEPAESVSCASDEQCGSDKMGLLQHKVQAVVEDEGEDEFFEDDEEDQKQEDDEEGYHDWVAPGSPISLSNADFAQGTLRIQQGGKYVLSEHIKFDPGAHGNDMYPAFDSQHYHHTLGYFLGFFAAIAVEADYVEIDCNNKKIEMSQNFHKHQRFFAHIELGSKPFITGAGPPPFSRPAMNPKPFVSPSYVRIRRCRFGLSSHYAVHGNDAKYVQIKKNKCTKFEVACVSLNNCENCRLENIQAETNLHDTFPSDLSQAILLDNLVSVAPSADANGVLADYYQNVRVPLRGKKNPQTADIIFRKLNRDLRDFLRKDSGDLATLLGNKGPPDGSATYGFVMNMRGPAAGVFGAEKGNIKDLKQQGVLVKRAFLKELTVRDLKLNPTGWISFRDPTDTDNKRKLQDPAGAVFRATKLRKNPGVDDSYEGNTLSDAQVAVAHVLLKAKEDKANGVPGAAQIAALADQYMGGSSLAVPWGEPALKWANHEITWNDFKQNYNVECNGDSMDHHNKGIVGVRLEYLNRPKVSSLDISELNNVGAGPEDPALCPAAQVNGNDVIVGNDVRGLLYVNVNGVNNVWNNVAAVDFNTLTAGVSGKKLDKEKFTTRDDVDENAPPEP